MNLNKISDRVYYIDSAVNMGLVVNDRGEALLIDTGIDESTGKKVLKLILGAGFALKGIILTHSHADHCGGAPHLVKATGARVYATGLEKGVIESPLWEPLYLFSGAYPPSPLLNKFFMAPGVAVNHTVVPGVINAGDISVEIVDLAGHSPGQIGVAAGGVLFCADSVIAPEVVEKHGIPLNSHLARALDTFDLLEARKDSLFIPAHGSPVSDLGPVIKANRSRVLETLSTILQLLDKPLTAEEILAEACSQRGISITNIGQQCLMNLTVMAYLGYLLEEGRIAVSYESNRQYFSMV
ncbi:MAG: hypothetical protein JL50_19110 [Peptococcaceae bacterium BICA1-7]|nr:MAG: hypothetical protein JL50_19110 [Peptococcaceae bacterium BICA1-7]HBV98950.1 MBL fold metallo-hydrolase [Desulfotomaculum sp.]